MNDKEKAKGEPSRFKKLLGSINELRKNIKSEASSENQIWYMPKPIILDELKSRIYVLLAAGIICAILFFLLIWASFTKIDERAVTFGVLVPVGKINSVQHLEGGIIKSIKVKDGDVVTKGQLLLEIDETASLSELNQLQAREATLSSNVRRLRAFVENSALSESPTSLLSVSKINLSDIIKGEQELLGSENQLREDQQDVLKAQAKQKAEEIVKLEQQVELVQKNRDLLHQELKMYEGLVKDNYVSQREYLEKQRNANDLQSEHVRLVSEIKKAKEALTESNEQLEELRSNLKKDAVDSLNKANAELLEVQYSIKKLEDRVKRSAVLAPVAGTVNGLSFQVGSVVQPGQELMRVVPEDQKLQVETKISTLDVGHVKPGDRAKVKVLTYDFARYGDIKGTLLEVSASTFEDTDKEAKPYYKGTISLDQQYVGVPSNKLRAGMTVEADIITGRKTVLQYLFKPVSKGFQNAFKER